MDANRELRVLHYSGARSFGGLGQLLVGLMSEDDAHLSVRHEFLMKGRIHPVFHRTIRRRPGATTIGDRWCGVRIPKWPRALRRLRQRGIVRRAAPDVILIWNSKRDDTLRDVSSVPIVYYNHGRAWARGSERIYRRFLAQVDGSICCSFAARRMLELRWGYSGPIQVCLNGLRPDLRPSEAPRQLGPQRPIRLGAAGELVPLKGFSLAIHALAELRQRGYDCELHLAGTGRDAATLEAQGRRRGVAHAVHVHGLVGDMSAFYRSVDLFLCPSIMESFGLVCLEAAAHGCPVIAARVDGLPEAVLDGVTGVCLTPELPLEAYRDLGGGPAEKLPPLVYDPSSDSLQRPKILDPARIADAVTALVEDPARFSLLSRNARARVDEDFLFTHYTTRLVRILRGFADAEPSPASSRRSPLSPGNARTACPSGWQRSPRDFE